MTHTHTHTAPLNIPKR